MIGRRLPALVGLAALVVAALVVDPPGDGAGQQVEAGGAATVAELSPLATRPDAGGSTWFCAAGTATPGGDADHSIVLFNPNDVEAAGTVQVFGEGAAPVATDVRVAPHARMSLALSQVVQAPYAAALVELDAGSVVAEQEVRGVGGWDSSRCSSQASTQWFFPWGRTALGSSLRLALFNPFPADAVVDLSFDTEEGFRTPEPFEGMLVPARRLVTVDVGAVVTRRERVSTKIVARTGRVVVDALQAVTGTDGSVVLDLSPGAGGPALTWYFAEGRADADTVERYAVFNPADQTAEVSLTLLQPVAGPGAEIEPFELRVPPNGYAEVVLNHESRVALPLRHSTVAQSLNGVGVVVERVQGSSTVAAVIAGSPPADSTSTTTAPGGTGATTTAAPADTTPTTAPTTAAPSDAATTAAPPPAGAAATTAAAQPADPAATTTTAPTATTAATASTAPAAPPTTAPPPLAVLPPLPAGLAASMGIPVVSPRWVLASAARSDTAAARLVVFNPSDTVAASLRLVALVDGREVPLEGPATVEPRRRVDVELQLPPGALATSLVVEAGGEVVVERAQTFTPLPDFSVEPAVPAPDGAVVPRPLG